MINVSELLTIQLLLHSIPHWKVNWIKVQTTNICSPVFRMDKLQYVKVQVSNCVTWTVHWQQLCHLSPPRLQRMRHN